MALKRRTEGGPLSQRERTVLEAVIRTYVETAEPVGGRTLARRYDLGVSAATIRNTMADLEADGYLSHPHASAGRVPADLAYRYFVDRLVRPEALTPEETGLIEVQLAASDSTVQQTLRSATRALGILVNVLGVGSVPQMEGAFLESIELIRVSSSKLLMVVTVGGGLVRTVYIDLPGEVPGDLLEELRVVLNERLRGITFAEIRRSFGDRVRDSVEDPATRDVLNIFVESSEEIFGPGAAEPGEVVLGRTSAMANQPEFANSERLMELIELTERKDLLGDILGSRTSGGGPYVTIGSEHAPELADFTLVTSGYRMGGLRGVVGVIGPTRMPYEKVIAIVDYTSSLVTRMLEP